jgi:CxxC motif-containing protein
MDELICIVCPRGCHLKIDGNNIVSGNQCKRGEIYALNERINPTRMLTSTVRINNSDVKRLPVITSAPIPKDKVFEVMKEITKISVKAPIKIHDVIIKNVLGLVDIIATRTIDIKENYK